MTTLPPVPGVLKFTLVWNLGAPSNASSHFFMHTTGSALATADLTAAAASCASAFDANVNADIPNTTVLVGTECEDLGHSTTIPGLWAGSHPGHYVVEGMTAETAGLINFHIARRYRGGKPRIYLPLGAVNQLSSPVRWTAAFQTAITADWANFIAALIAAGASGGQVDKQVSVSYWSAHALRVTPLVDDVVSARLNAIPASQRRRMGR